MNYRTRDGDMVDAIAWKVYGREDMAALIYALNPGLAARGCVLSAGLLIKLPEAPVPPRVKPVLRLWGEA